MKMGRAGHKSPTVRREYIKKYWLEHGKPPSIPQLREIWPLRHKTLQKDVNAVIDEVKDPELVDHIRTKFLFELTKRIPDMKDGDFVKLTKHFIPEKAEVTTDGITRYEFVVVEPDGNNEDTGKVEPTPETVDSPPE